ncbi:MAG: hypothetical protein ACRETA_12030, partial [Gammaproteobacteria bacterium]
MTTPARTASARILILAACLTSACSHMVKPVVARHATPAATQPAPTSYAARPEVQQFIAQLVQQDGFDKAWLEKAFDSAHRRDNILAAIAK